ncbi:MAG: decaprenylphospho-beta-D-erythro-pentofuranosid-2-ulose 2-reductase [Propionicimonas sp.]|uniref:decaprenylphospho-beta-D-erythro-pentofuranosid- 2-ulose 2-reductase n=1 Tax=Propionicimonas sp. TaxID=1955623 RepID=UPI002B1EA1BD|nr:decaprenylphospho-beta-D-erythro-pentofuranosid-2-ulose 2-reductase [Propionicimonas sp.]MEA4944280.1 decaprenylphospho-beta-D-erythro-pentofuranosid-2-ulose 2-reductase [Propionicimonas sp.]MEA5119049.1 decaprenylphospho-beta-D-erythro-pentofuranosid-2-ulose 2-reductase [Propionicimonas sp.]
MIDATGNPQTVLLLGGTSDIGLAIVGEYLAKQPLRVVLAARPSPGRDEAAAGLRAAGASEVDVLDFDATAFDTHPGVIDAAWEIADVDVAIVAFGLLGDAEQAWQDQAAAVALAQVNYTGAVSVGVLLGQRMKAQGYGQIIALSSVAGEIVRRSNFVYGSTKAGFDGFYRLLGEALEPFGPKVLVVRPGQVRTKMLTGLKPGPGVIAPEALARTVVDAARDGRTLIWVPAFFRPMMWVLKHVPGPIFRRLPI